ncbi:penicillin-binding protein activator LpoB [Serratia rubidaea]
MKKYLFVAAAALVLTGCPQRPPEQPEAPVTITPVTPEETTPVPHQPEPPTSEPVPQPPKIQSFNWLGSVQPLIAQMLKADGVTPGSVLLLDSVKNNTNGSLQTGKATAALHKALGANQTFTVVPQAWLTSAKQTLGLSAEDSLGSRSKAIGLARIVNAQYVLYSDASGDVKSPQLDMQLMLVQTGEIIWSGNGAVKR